MLEVFFLVVEEVVFEAVAVVSFSVVVLSVSLSEEMSLSASRKKTDCHNN